MANSTLGRENAVNVASYMTGMIPGWLEVVGKTVSDVLSEQGIGTDSCVVELVSADGSDRPNATNTVLNAGDYLSITKRSNKSG